MTGLSMINNANRSMGLLDGHKEISLDGRVRKIGVDMTANLNYT